MGDRKLQKSFDLNKFVDLALSVDRTSLSYLDNPIFRIHRDIARICADVADEVKMAVVAPDKVAHLKVRNMNFRVPGHAHLISWQDIVKAYDNPMGQISSANRSLMGYLEAKFNIKPGEDFEATSRATFPREAYPMVVMYKMLMSLSNLKDSMMIQGPFEFSDTSYFKTNYLQLCLYRMDPVNIMAIQTPQVVRVTAKVPAFMDNLAYLLDEMTHFDSICNHYEIPRMGSFDSTASYDPDTVRCFFLDVVRDQEPMDRFWELRGPYPLYRECRLRENNFISNTGRCYVGVTQGLLMLIPHTDTYGELIIIAEEKTRDSIMAEVRALFSFLASKYKLPSNDLGESYLLQPHKFDDLEFSHHMTTMSGVQRNFNYGNASIMFVPKLYSSERFSFRWQKVGSYKKKLSLELSVNRLKIELNMDVINVGLPLVRLDHSNKPTPDYLQTTEPQLYYKLKYLYHWNADMATDLVYITTAFFPTKKLEAARRMLFLDSMKSTRLWFRKYTNAEDWAELAASGDARRIVEEFDTQGLSGEARPEFFEEQINFLGNFLDEVERRNLSLSAVAVDFREDAADRSEFVPEMVGDFSMVLAQALDFMDSLGMDYDLDEDAPEDFEVFLNASLKKVYRGAFALDKSSVGEYQRFVRGKKMEIEEAHPLDVDRKLESNLIWSMISYFVSNLDLSNEEKVCILVLLDRFESDILGPIDKLDVLRSVVNDQKRFLKPKGGGRLAQAIQNAQFDQLSI
jgi:hypothetical protein